MLKALTRKNYCTPFWHTLHENKVKVQRFGNVHLNSIQKIDDYVKFMLRTEREKDNNSLFN